MGSNKDGSVLGNLDGAVNFQEIPDKLKRRHQKDSTNYVKSGHKLLSSVKHSCKWPWRFIREKVKLLLRLLDFVALQTMSLADSLSAVEGIQYTK